MHNERLAGHVCAAITILIWGTTFISTKVLLTGFQPVEILFFRFLLGYAALALAAPRPLKGVTKRQELTFALAGLCGGCLYYLLENIALTYTLASNVGVIISIAPFFTALLSRFLQGEGEAQGPGFAAGFVVAMAGIFLISFNGARLQVNPLGDLLAVGAALTWAVYALLTKKIGGFGYGAIQSTRRVFFYGLVFMLPALFAFRFEWGLARLAQPVYLLNLLFLGLGASALCFVSWGVAVKRLGAVKTSVYIYLVPVITVITSVLVLGEPVTPLALAGTVLTLAGLGLSQWPAKRAVTANEK